MDWLLYLKVFMVGGLICLLGQILIITTKITTSRILVLFLLIGVALEAFQMYQPFAEWAASGATVPIIGFGSALSKGAIEGAKTEGLLGAIKGGLSATSAGISMSVVSAFIFALIFNARTKKC